MKKIILLTALAACASGTSAEIRYQSLDNIGATNIVLIDNNAPERVEVSGAVLHDNGKEYEAKSIRSDLKDGTATYKLSFKRLTFFKDCRLTITVNGTEHTIDIQKALTDM